jgi:acetyltransferase-like isoleucine patch superfamily enzyme
MQSVEMKAHPQENIAPTVRILGEAYIGKDVVIHDFVTIYPNVVIEDNVEVFECAVIGRPPKGTKAIARSVSKEPGTTRIGRDSVISPHTVIYSNVEVGESTLIGDGASIREQCRIGKSCIIGRNVTMHYNTVVGDGTKIMDGTNITGNARIGSHVFISTLVATTNDNKIGSLGYSDHVVGPTIEDNVAIGAGANILPAVNVGHGAIVGAGSVVTKDVPPKKLVMGIPARVVRDLE